MTRSNALSLALLGWLVITSAMAVAYVKYLTRMEFVHLQEIRAARDALDVEWGRLRLEEASLTAHSRVEEQARRVLGMSLPQATEVRVLEVSPNGS